MIDLRSDTVTVPTNGMLKAVHYARVGDDILGEDLSVKELEKIVASMLGKQAGIFTVSGTMSNQIAVMTFCERGDEIIVGEKSHIYNLEAGGIAALSQVQVRPIEFSNDQVNLFELEKSLRPRGIQSPRQSLLCLENTYDLNRGIAIPPEQIEMASNFAHRNRMKVYLDGARIINAAVKLNITLDKLCAPVDAVQICLTKGVSAPFGAILTGSEDFIEKARWMKQRLGGGFRQAGYMAAVAIEALKTAQKQVEEDNRKAEYLASLLEKQCPDLLQWQSNQTNIIKISVLKYNINEDTFLKKIKDNGILIKPLGNSEYRIVCHKDVSWSDLKKVSDKICAILNS